jgi:hypothetical protein
VLHYLPSAMIVLGCLSLVLGEETLVVGGFVAALGIAAARCLPWRFAVTDDGIALWFGWTKRRFLERSTLVVRVDPSGAVVQRDHVRYPLPGAGHGGHPSNLRAVLTEHGFVVT